MSTSKCIITHKGIVLDIKWWLK